MYRKSDTDALDLIEGDGIAVQENFGPRTKDAGLMVMTWTITSQLKKSRSWRCDGSATHATGLGGL